MIELACLSQNISSDKSIVNNERTINSKRDFLWNLVNNLLMIFDIFDMNNPLEPI